MKLKKLWCIFAALIVLSGCSDNQKEDPSKLQDVTITDAQKDIAEELAYAICSGDTKALREDFQYNDAMRAAVSEDSFQEQMKSFAKSSGKLTSIRTAYAQRYQGNTVVFQPVIAEHQRFNLQITFVKDDIGGIFFKPFQEQEEVMDIEGIQQKQLNLSIKEGGEMKGYLCQPDTKEKHPLVILLGGSGPSDHNETIGAQKPFYELAVELAKQGIATYRFDKRTLDNSFAQTDTIQQEYIDDALSAIALMKQQKTIDTEHIYLLGHSQGGYILPRIAKQTKDVRGYIFMAAPARPIEDSLVEQIEYLAAYDDSISKEEQKQIDEAKQIRERIKKIEEADNEETFFGLSRAYLMDLKNYDPIQAATAIEVPVLLTQGLRDYQVTKTDLKLWQNAFEKNSNWTIKTYPTANHLMSEGSEKPGPSNYDQKAPLQKAFVEDIVTFVKK